MTDLRHFPDEELYRLLKQGDESAFTSIYNYYWKRLYYVAYKLLKDSAASEEIVQDVFFTLWRKREELAIENLSYYLAAMTRYAVYRFLSKEKQSKTREDKVGQINAQAVTQIEIENKILLEMVTELSQKLPEKCRLVFQYNKLQDKPLSEVAAELNISQKTAEAHLTKALRLIRANMGNVTNCIQLVALLTLLKK